MHINNKMQKVLVIRQYRQRTMGVRQITIGWNDQHSLCKIAFQHEVLEQIKFGCQRRHPNRLTRINKGIELGLIHKIKNKRNMGNRLMKDTANCPLKNIVFLWPPIQKLYFLACSQMWPCDQLLVMAHKYKCSVQIPL